MSRKPHSTTAARLVHAYLSDLGLTVSDRQSKDLVAIVEGYKNWQTFRASQEKKSSGKPEAAPTPYEQAWAVLRDVIDERMQALYEAINQYFYVAISSKNMTLWRPVLDTDADEWSSWMWLEDAQGRSLLTAKMALVEDESDARAGFSVRFELEAPCEGDRILMSWVAAERYGDGAWTPLQDVQDLVRELNQSFSASEVVYLIQDQGIFR